MDAHWRIVHPRVSGVLYGCKPLDLRSTFQNPRTPKGRGYPAAHSPAMPLFGALQHVCYSWNQRAQTGAHALNPYYAVLLGYHCYDPPI